MKREAIDIDKIQDLIFSFAQGHLSKRGEISPNRDNTDAIIAGINMLGEELEAITVSRDYFSSIYDALPIMLFVLDENASVLKVNEAACKVLNCKKDHIVGRKITGFFDDSIKRKLLNDLEKNSGNKLTAELTFCHGHKEFPVKAALSKIRDTNKSNLEYLFIGSDITKEKKLEKEILNAIITTEEKEKTRIAYDLHDSLGQKLNAIKMYFDVALRSLDDPVQFKSVVNECKSLVDDSIESVRIISKELMPKALEDGELFHALRELSNSYTQLINIETDLPIHEFDLPIENKVKIYRIVQEFITNSLKHAQASKIVLKSTNNLKGYSYTFSDDGCGFDITKATIGNGIKNIETRLRALNADFSFTSIIEKGTMLKFEIKK